MLAFLLAGLLTCPVPGSMEIVGLWESRETSKGGIGHTVEFREDGTFVEAITVIVNGFYRLDGNRLLLSETVGGTEAGSQFRVEGNTFVHIGPDGSVSRKERLKGPSAAEGSVAGNWSYRHYTGAIAFERYTNNGQMLFRLPLKSSSGCYSVSGRGLSWSPQGRNIVAKLQVRGDTLALENPARSTTVYVREPSGPWYDREHLDIKPVR